MPVPVNPGMSFGADDEYTTTDFTIGDEPTVPAGSPLSEVFAAFDRWRSKQTIEPSDGEAIEVTGEATGGSFSATGIPFMDFTDRLTEPRRVDVGRMTGKTRAHDVYTEIHQPLFRALGSALGRGTPYLAGENGRIAIFVRGIRKTPWHSDPAEAIEDYDHDPDFAFEKIEDVAEHIIIPVDDLVDICAEYLSGLGCTFWSDFDISRDPTRAARWLAEQIKGVGKIADEDGEDRG